ncbi:MAG: methyltransferase domain-containing protein [Cellvibrionaceae bacterium]|nr:methyltransferase domain-containing protein [Cellvibrionaceae bacterium]MCV6627559.1 methyltransferase domain-containing protein [Cellvibrionaceae bacterium]
MADRNFDDLVEHFAGKIYGDQGQQRAAPKGALRQAVIERDLRSQLPQLYSAKNQIKILDVGAGLGQFVCQFAALGHQLHYNDISVKMSELARAQMPPELAAKIRWSQGPYQNLLEHDNFPGRYDLVLCHALIEWLQEPAPLLRQLDDLLMPGGYVSLCHYNPAGKVLRNLVAGNFKAVKQPKPPHANSLTPPGAPSNSQIDEWITQSRFNEVCRSGIRVFSDYALQKRGGLADVEQVMALELEYSQRQPFIEIGRYRHVLLKKIGRSEW